MGPLTGPEPGPLGGPSACTRHPDAQDVVWVPVEEQSDVGAVRRQAVAVAAQVGLDEHRRGELAIVASELAGNLSKHAGGGAVAVRVLRSPLRAGVEFVAVDSGPGIGDVALAGRDGFSSAGTLGIGLGAIIRLSDRARIFSLPGRGTVVTATIGAPATGNDVTAHHEPATDAERDGDAHESTDLADPADPGDVAGLTRALRGEAACGDAVAWRCLPDGRRVLLVVDGLGHGELAAAASRAAVRAFGDLPDAAVTDPTAVLARLHRALSGTRGAAAGVAVLSRAAGQLDWSGVGNIALRVLAPDGRDRSLSCQPGILGERTRTLRTVTEPLPEGAVVVLHSDGLTTRWHPRDLPGLTAQPSLVIAATLLREAGQRRDDASVLVDAPVADQPDAVDPGRWEVHESALAGPDAAPGAGRGGMAP